MRLIALLPLALLFCVGVLPIGTARAGVQTIEVLADITGTSPMDAQQKAVDYAKKRAFFLLLSKASPDKAETIARAMSDAQINTHIRGYEVIQDKLEGNHYVANYKVSVSEDMVARLLATDKPLEATAPNPTLIIPVLHDGSRTLLWEAENTWRSIWNGVALQRGEGILIMPYGDPKDALIADSSTILSFGYEPLAAIAERYGAGEVVVAYAQYQPEKTPAGLLVSLRRLSPKMDKLKDVYFETDGKEQTPEALLPDAAKSIADQLKEIARLYEGEEEKKIANAKQMPLHVEFRRLNDWVKMQTLLLGLPRVVRLKVDRINVQSADATLYYDGTPETMEQIFTANGLRATPANGGFSLSLQ